MELQEQFIDLRASSLSYDKIAKQQKISKPTLIKWTKQFENDNANIRTVNMTALYEQYKISKQHKLEIWAEQLQTNPTEDVISSEEFLNVANNASKLLGVTT